MQTCLNINIVFPLAKISDLEKTLASVQDTIAKFPGLAVSVSAAPSAQVMRVASPVVNGMRTPEENKLRDEYKASEQNPLAKGFRFCDWMSAEYQSPLEALRAWKAGVWTVNDSIAKQQATRGATGYASQADSGQASIPDIDPEECV